MLRTGPYGDGFGADPDGLTLAKLEAHPHGIDFGPLQPRVPEVLRTPSGKIELAPEILPRRRRAPARRCSTAPRAPTLVLVGRRDLRSNNSWMHNLPVLVKGKARCTLHVHPDDARARGCRRRRRGAGALRRAGEVVVAGRDHRRGPARCREHAARVGSRSAGHAAHGRGRATRVRTATCSRARDLFDPLSGNAVLNGIPVELEPA